jgi:archaellum component FlaC
VHELLKQLRNEVHELKREVRELRETVASQAK